MLTISDAQNLRVCAARRAVQALGVSLYRCIREEESCTLWAGIAETIQAQTETMMQVLADLRRIDPNGEWHADDFPFDDPEACQDAMETLENLRA
jgi:hypothetical protein